jgi:hypothetical protein
MSDSEETKRKEEQEREIKYRMTPDEMKRCNFDQTAFSKKMIDAMRNEAGLPPQDFR